MEATARGGGAGRAGLHSTSRAGDGLSPSTGELLFPETETLVSKAEVGDLYCRTLRLAIEVCERHSIEYSTVQVEVLGSGDVAAC